MTAGEIRARIAEVRRHNEENAAWAERESALAELRAGRPDAGRADQQISTCELQEAA